MNIGNAAIFVLNEAYRVIHANRLACRQFSRSGELDGLLHRPLHEVLVVEHDGALIEVDDLVSGVMRLHRVREYQSGLILHAPDLVPEEIKVVVHPIESEGATGAETPVAVVAVEWIGEQRRLWMELQKLQRAENLHVAMEGLSNVLLDCSTALMSDVESIERSASHDGSADWIKATHRIHGVAHKVYRLGVQLDRFMDRIVDGGDAEGEFSVTEDVAEIVHDTVTLAAGGAPVKTTFFMDGVIPAAALPPHALSHALFNVVVNAVEAMDDTGILRVEVCNRDGAIGIIIRDNGTGMDPRIAGEVFRPYFTTKEDRAGMGLSISMSILQQHGGRIAIQTDPGFGTDVTIHLPVATERGDTPRPVTDENSRLVHDTPAELKGLRVLLVEDDPLVRSSVEQIISHLGCEVTAVPSGERAIEVVRKSLADGTAPFDILVTDLAMPGQVDGVQLLQRVREFIPELPAVLSSGALHRKSEPYFRDADFQYVLRKPYGRREMRDALTTAVGTNRHYA